MIKKIIRTIKGKKKILYIDMDGVVANFDKAINALFPGLQFLKNEERQAKVDELCEANPDIFHTLEPISNAINSINILFDLYDIYFLSTAMWDVPNSFTHKRLWIEKHFGSKAKKRLILTHRKDLNIGDYLVDDRLKNGAGEFKGKHIHFGNGKFTNWAHTTRYLIKHANTIW